MELPGLKLRSDKPIDQSADSIVYLAYYQFGDFFNSSPLFVSDYADPEIVAVQLLDPLVARFGLAAAKKAADHYEIVTNNFSSRGIRSLQVPNLGLVEFAVNPIIAIASGNKLALLSPFVPGPQLEQVFGFGDLEKEYPIADHEKESIRKNFKPGDLSRKWQLQNALYLVGMELRRETGIVELDPVNVKLRWNQQTNLPLLIVTDIQKQIGQHVIF